MADPGERFPRRYKYYEILEISKNATQEEIRKAFRRLAQKYHPDRNLGDREAEAKFKKINEAYQILSSLIERSAYDSSPAECPVCWTHEVVQISGNNWRCRHCGCQFDVFGSPLSETVERAAISGRYRVRLMAFQSMQCSWCRRFFTQPFLCPDRKLHSNCFFFDRLSEEERDRFINDEKWWWRVIDLVRWVENNGVIKKCTHCGALNPNPEKLTCWNCGHNIYDRCANCGLPTLYFDLDSNLWRCSNAKCYGKRFDFEKERVRYTPQGVVSNKCPECGRNLRFDSAMLFWRCTNPKCCRIYTYEELRKARREKPGQKPPVGPIPSRGKIRRIRTSVLHISRRFRSSLSRTWNAIPISVRKLSLSLLVISGLVLAARTGYLLFTHQTDAIEIHTIMFLVELGLSIWIISILRSYRYRRGKPSFKLVFFSLFGIALVCAFAGIEPLASYKDRTISFVGQTWQSVMTPSQFPTQVPAEPTPGPTELTPVPVEPMPTPTTQLSISQLEQETFRLINVERNRAGASSTKWDAELYELSKAHTQAMAERGELFHTPVGASYGENCWGGKGYYRYSDDELPAAVVESWMSSPLHRAWLLHEPLRTSVVSIVITPDGQYASWTFWTDGAGEGPELVRKIADEWRRETGGSIPWIEWLKMKGYL